jgi:hypothetical protein
VTLLFTSYLVITAVAMLITGWGVGNALFIATSLAVIVASATGGFVGAIILYETALGLGIAVGQPVWCSSRNSKPARKTGLLEPLKALRHRGLAILSLTALCYNWVFFTVLGYAPFPMKPRRDPAGVRVHRLGSARRVLLRVRRAVAAGTVRHRPHPVSQPVMELATSQG